MQEAARGAAPRHCCRIGADYQQGAHQQRIGPQTRCLPGGHQRPQPPQAAWWIGVAFCACAWIVAAPWVCALAANAVVPSANATAKVMVSFLMRASLGVGWGIGR